MSPSLLILAALLVAPGLAGWRLVGADAFWFLAGGCFVMSGLTYFLYADDKRRAQRGAWRIPEMTLHLCEQAGGWPGAFLAQRRLRHKNAKLGFQFVFLMIVAAHQFVAVDYLLGGSITHAAFGAVGGSAKAN